MYKRQDLALEIASSETKTNEYYAKLTIFTEIKEQYFETGVIDILSINNYISAMNSEKHISVKQFIEVNDLLKKGFSIVQNMKDDRLNLGIKIDVDKVKKSISARNILFDLFPEIEEKEEKNEES